MYSTETRQSGVFSTVNALDYNTPELDVRMFSQGLNHFQSLGKWSCVVPAYILITSPLLSNLIMRNHDAELNEIAKNYGLTYTRYSDDLSFSTRSKTFNRVTAKEVIKKVYDILSRAGFRPQSRKTKIIPPRSKKIILGLNVDGAVPRLQKEFKDRLRQHLYYLEKLGPIEHANRREFDSVWGMKCHIKGLIDYANMIEPEYSMLCLEKFEKFEWPV